MLTVNNLTWFIFILLPLDQKPFSKRLQYTKHIVVEKSLCELHYQETFFSKLCVSTRGGKTPSDGDSGGPLLTNFNPDFGPRQIGILSVGHMDDEKTERPVIYTRVSSYLKWIKEKSGVANY